MKQTESELSRVQGEVANKVNAKLRSVLERNPGYSTLYKVPDIICGNEAELGGTEHELSATDLTLQVLTHYVVRCREEFFQV